MLGVIGRNGAGKSTLLKILTRITTPTEGRAEIRGRVGSLLEVGTGFHPELTGRENVYLNGAILGMKRKEIQREAPRDRRVLRRREVPRHAGEALLERHVRAARVLRRGALRAGDPARRRGARRRRRRVPGALPRAHGGLRRRPAARCSSSRTTCRRSRSSATARSCSTSGAGRHGRPERGGRRALPPDDGRDGSSRTWADLEESARATTSSGFSRCASSREDGETADYVDVREPVGIELAFTRARATGPPVLPKIKVAAGGQIAFNAMDVDPRWHDPSPPGRLRRDRVDPGQLPERGPDHRRRRPSCSIDSPKLHHHVSVHEAVSFHVQDPAEGDSSRGTFTGQWRGVVRPLLEWSCERSPSS